jgi:hypothetical protein
MKLHEIKDITQHQVVLESAIPIHLLMVLNEIHQAGKCTNTIHFNVLLQLIEMFRFGKSHSPRYLEEFRTPKDRLDELKALKGEQQAELAIWALERLVNEDWQESMPKCNASLDLNAWIAHVKNAQE